MTNELPRFEMRPLGQEEGGGYLIEFPEYPGCVADGETPEEAMVEGADALESYRNTLRGNLNGLSRHPVTHLAANGGNVY